jgi:hypothetical protein
MCLCVYFKSRSKQDDDMLHGHTSLHVNYNAGLHLWIKGTDRERPYDRSKAHTSTMVGCIASANRRHDMAARHTRRSARFHRQIVRAPGRQDAANLMVTATVFMCFNLSLPREIFLRAACYHVKNLFVRAFRSTAGRQIGSSSKGRHQLWVTISIKWIY